MAKMRTNDEIKDKLYELQKTRKRRSNTSKQLINLQIQTIEWVLGYREYLR